MCNFRPFNAHIQIFSYVFLNFSQQILTFTKIHTGYPAQTALLKSHCRGGNAHSYACVRLFLRVVCFILDQTIVASDKCLSYARILLFPTGTQYPVGAHYTVSCVGFIIWFPSGRLPRVINYAFDQSFHAKSENACLLLVYSFSPRVQSIPRGPRIFARNDKVLRTDNSKSLFAEK